MYVFFFQIIFVILQSTTHCMCTHGVARNFITKYPQINYLTARGVPKRSLMQVLVSKLVYLTERGVPAFTHASTIRALCFLTSVTGR